MNELPKVVFSKTIKGPLKWKNATLANGDLAAEIQELKRAKGPLLRSIGSMQLVKSLVALNLVDKLRLMVFPTVLGTTGTEPIFAGLPHRSFDLVEQKVLDRSTLLLEYRFRK